MTEIPLQSAPNQRVAVSTPGAPASHALNLRSFAGLLYATVESGGETLVSGVRCVPGELLVPWPCRERGANFLFRCDGGRYPHWTGFGTWCRLLLLTPGEAAAHRATNP